MLLKIDFDSDIPIYNQIKTEIIKGIARGEIEEGEILPSVRGLASDIEVNMHTVNKTYNILKDEGYIKIDRRKGAFISLNLEESNNKFKRNFEEELEYYIAECCNRGISKDDINKIIDEKYGLFKEKK
ncbi:GntR family transcriptional regulator [Clostridium sp. NSJ-6]|uniref:GntR family transcriptional regulator n=1 Tax=Clostridium hominis TaxID=2763036 RepID=A0ABR7DF86_9CLOT|nr:GntR family transcriptional regulator [Clostridium hominis]MBC5630064.1 GntR family transcriptional regulator [Clostridium hominis]MDU2672222.1 GntR family transcriptional regulator [Clostridium sp.]